MNRRDFLSLFSTGVAGIALEQAIPLGRVWGFPKEIVIPDFLFVDQITNESLRILKNNLRFANEFEPEFNRAFAIGQTLHVKFPALYAARGPIWFDKLTAAFPPDSSHTPS
jgi:hypothetical protein